MSARSVATPAEALDKRDILRVLTAFRKGDFSARLAFEGTGLDGKIADALNQVIELNEKMVREFLRTARVVNTMVGRLNAFASEATRVAREVGSEGKLGGQAVVQGVAGTWKDLTESFNSMASNLTNQVRGIAKVVTAVANGDLQQKITV